MKNQHHNLPEGQQKYLFDFFQNCEELFYGTLFTCKTDPTYFKLKEKYELI